MCQLYNVSLIVKFSFVILCLLYMHHSLQQKIWPLIEPTHVSIVNMLIEEQLPHAIDIWRDHDKMVSTSLRLEFSG